MKIMYWVIFAMGTVLIVVHGFWSNTFRVDLISISILFILSIPFVAQFLKKAKFPGAEFEFKEEIRETQKLVELSVEKAKEIESSGKAEVLKFETFKLSGIRELLDSDPVLALAALRIEIERKLKLTANFLHIPIKDKYSISKMLEAFKINEILSSDQINALKKIATMCNEAVHGSLISKEEAAEIVNLAEELNKSFSIGYSIDFSTNANYKQHSLTCEYEHCIELMPLTEEETQNSCPLWGHNCPGGTEKISKCNKTIADIPKSRFIKS